MDEHVKVMALARRQGKSAMLGMMYGSGLKGFSQSHTIPREHPLEFDSQYNFAGREPRFGNVPVYKVNTKLTSQIICGKEKIPHTCVHYRMLDDLSSWVDPSVAALVWTRATPADQLETAVATAIMMGHTPVLLRAFDPSWE
jgi:hypothetical protein